MLKKAATRWGLVAAALLLGLAVFLGQHRVLLKRYFTQGDNAGPGGMAWYAPTETVPGGHSGFMPVAPASARTVAAAALQAASDYAARNLSESLLIWQGGQLQLAQYWLNIRPDSLVNSRSMHKMAGGLLVGRAIQLGNIGGLDDSVTSYIAPWRGTDKSAMTLRHVLQMSSGLRWFNPERNPFGVAVRRYLDPYWDRILLERVTMSFPPGSAYDYSDITADVLPHIIEGASGQRYADYLGRNLLAPIGALGGRIWVNRPGGMPHGGCCLMLPAETWLRLGILVLQRGRWEDQQLLPDWWFDALTTPSPNNPNFGLMIWLGQPYRERRLYHRPDSPRNQVARPGVYHSEPYLADDLILFDGAEGRTVYIVPSRQLVIARTGFRPPPGAPEWDNAFLPNTILRGLADPR